MGSLVCFDIVGGAFDAVEADPVEFRVAVAIMVFFFSSDILAIADVALGVVFEVVAVVVAVAPPVGEGLLLFELVVVFIELVDDVFFVAFVSCTCDDKDGFWAT